MNIVIVGGGTAGWLTALYAKKIYPNENISLIESEEIGILGAGEGSTPHLIDLFDFLEIPFSDLVKNCNATVKNGIKFTNWSNKNDYFFHPFASKSPASNDYNFFFNPYLEQETGFSHIASSKFKHNLNDYAFIQKMSNNFLVPFVKNDKISVSNSILKFNNLASWSLHFDARTLAKYLRKIGELRNIVRIEGTVKNIKTDEQRYINSLIVNDKEILVDFVFDCTGFKRLIIGNFYKSQWKSHSNHLPAKKAIPFFLPIDKKVPPYTEAIAMNCGWMWKIPLQHRYGCGYVFDSDFISEDNAKKEIDSYFKFEVESPKTFSFNAGCYKKIWIKNCLALGLSSGFIEPLEATSLWQLETTLKLFFSSSNSVLNKNENSKFFLNNAYLKQTEEIVDFLYLHYVTNKKTNNFWKNFTKNNEMPDFIDKIFKILKDKPVEDLDFYDRLKNFSVPNYFYVLIGNKIITEKNLNKYLSLLKQNKTQTYLNILENQNKIIPLCWSHKEFLEELKNG